MEVLLDTNFIISCIRMKIDFISKLNEMGFKIVLPREVFQELKDLKVDEKTSRADRTAIDIAFSIFESEGLKKISLGGKNVDGGLIKKGREGVYVATLDRAIQRAIPNKVVILSSKKRLVVRRDYG